MTPRTISQLALAVFLFFTGGGGGSLQANDGVPPGYNTTIPEAVLTPDKVESPIGTFSYFDGLPDQQTMELARRQVDLGRGVRAFLDFVPAASMEMLYASHRDGYGITSNNQVGIFEGLMDSDSLWLTGNTDTVYASAFLDLSDGPIVVEVPPGTGPGTINDAFFRFVVDMGAPGPDKGKGGKYLIIPTDYEGEIPEGYFVAKSPSLINWLILRGFLDGEGKTTTAVESFRQGLKIYPLAQKDAPPEMEFIKLTGLKVNTIHSNDYGFYEEVNEVIQREPNAVFSPELLGVLASLGIEKGQPFQPNDRMKEILTEAVAIGNATARAIVFAPRDPQTFIYEDQQGYWQTGFLGGSYQWLKDEGKGGRFLDARTMFFYLATVNTPAMQLAIPGVGSQYALVARDGEGNYLDGSQNYKLTIPANPPAKDFWSFVVYDPQTRSMLQSKEQPYPSKNSKRDQDMAINPEGSVDLYFGPKAPQGKEANWIKTIPGKGWFGLLRLYGPLQPWFDQSWKVGAIEKL